MQLAVLLHGDGPGSRQPPLGDPPHDPHHTGAIQCTDIRLCMRLLDPARRSITQCGPSSVHGCQEPVRPEIVHR
jgi:hypothetical protein